MNPHIAIIRPNVCALTALGLIIGAIVAGTAAISLSFIIAVIAAFLICGTGNVINDYFDREIDKTNAPHRPIPAGLITLASALKYFCILTAIGMILAFFVGIAYLAIAAFNWIIALIYPWKAKKIPIVKNIFVAYLASSSFLAAGLILGISISAALLFLITISFIVTLGREIIKDMADIRGDIRAKVRTLPSIAGEKPAKAFAYILIVIGCILLVLPYALNLFSYYYLIGAIPAIATCLYSSRQPPIKAQSTMKIAIYLAMIGFLLGTLVHI